MTRSLVARLGFVSSGLLCAGCPGIPKEGPPPAESLEIASAAPHALGALAAGTEAAPRAVTAPGAQARPGPDEPAPEADGDEDEEDGGSPVPDAGMSSPEDLPL